MLDTLVLIKVAATVSIVVGLSLVAEHLKPRVAGVLSGFPLGVGISLFFYGYEISPEFAADSAVYTLVGLVAIQGFNLFYYLTSSKARRLAVPVSAAGGLAGFFLVSWLLHFISVGLIGGLLIALVSMAFFIYLFNHIDNHEIKARVQLSHRVLLARALVAAAVIVVVTGVAEWLGTLWAGLFAAFPFTLLPLLVIVHHTYEREHAHTILKNFSQGLGATICYIPTVWFCYPRFGVGWGTVIALSVAVSYLVIYGCYVTRRDAVRGRT